jgi:uncharacterized protein YbjT (DUF2867 family)
MKTLVTGGTGHLGRDLVALLQAAGHQVRVLTRRPGDDPTVEWVRGDLATGEGVRDAVSGAATIVHAATLSPAAIRGYLLPTDLFRSPSEVDIDGTRRLIEAAAGAGTDHFLHVSIVGVDQSRLPYTQVKFDAEKVVRDSQVPWTIARATAFHWLLERMMNKISRLPIWLLPTDLAMQPVDSREFAEFIVASLDEGPSGYQEDFGGPEIGTFGGFASQYREARGLNRRIVRIPVPARARREMEAMTSPSRRRGRTTWKSWLTCRS